MRAGEAKAHPKRRAVDADRRRFGAFSLVFVVGLTGALVAGLAVEDAGDTSLIGVAVAHSLLTLLLLLWREDTSRNPRATREALLRVLVLFVPVTGVVVATFALTPGLARRLFRPPPIGQTGFDFGGDLRPGDVAELALSTDVAFRARFLGGTIPPIERLYWRGSVYARSEGLRWRMGAVPRSEASDALARKPPSNGEQRVVHEVVVEPRPSRLLFALDWAYGARASTESEVAESEPTVVAGAESGTGAGSRGATGRTRRVERLPGNALLPLFESPLRRAVARVESGEAPLVDLTDVERIAYLQTPFSTPAALESLVASIGQRRDDFTELSRWLSAWFPREGFVYSLTPGVLPDTDSAGRLVAFLRDTRTGYCEHYAGALATLFRLAGIPARVVVGYQGGVRNESLSLVTVRDAESHAWVEAFDAVGRRWRRFDATAWIAPDRLASGRNLPLFTSSGTWVRDLFRVVGNAFEPLRSTWAFVASGFRDQRGFDVLTDFAGTLWREERGGLLAWTSASAVSTVVVILVARRRAFLRGARADDLLAVRYRESMEKAFVRAPVPTSMPGRGEPVLAMAQRLAEAFPEAGEPARAAAEGLSLLLYGMVDEPRARALRKEIRAAIKGVGRARVGRPVRA